MANGLKTVSFLFLMIEEIEMKIFFSYFFKSISILSLLILIGCGAGPGEPPNTGICTKYYVENNSNYELKIETINHETQTESLKYSAVSGTRVLLDQYCNNSTKPSYTFIDLRIYADFGSGNSLVYSGVKDADWKNEGKDAEQNYTQVLSIADSDFLKQ